MEDYRKFNVLDGNAVRELPDRGSFVPEALPQTGYEPETESERISESREEAGRQVHPRRAPEREKQVVSLSAVAGFVLVAFLAVAVLGANVRLNDVYSAIVSQQKQLVQLESEYSKLKAADEEIFDNEHLRLVAEEHGLSKPNMGQRVYLELSDPNNTVVYSRADSGFGLSAVADWFKTLF